MVHISMMNSYNVLTGKVKVGDVLSSGIGMFSHSLESKDAMESVNFMIMYFQQLEMYERCSKLKKYVDKTFNKDGTFKQEPCSCDYPEIEEYESPLKCSICNLKVMM